jgi:Protein of unknown function (DUF2637)
MNIKPSAAARGALRGTAWLIVLGVILAISAYSLYYVARHLGVPKLFAMGMSTAYDGTALIAADKSLQYAQEGRSGAAPRLVMIIFAGLSAWLNSLHSVLGHESPLAIPVWAGLPIAAATVFELHTSQARARAMARLGKKYPSPLPSWGGITWLLFPLNTLDKLRDYVYERTFALSRVQARFLRDEQKDLRRHGIHAPGATGTVMNGRERLAERNERPSVTPGTGERPGGRTVPVSERTARNDTNVVTLTGRAAHRPHRHIRDWAKAQGHLPPENVRGAIPAWIHELYERETAGTGEPERTNGPAGTNGPERAERTDGQDTERTEADG